MKNRRSILNISVAALALINLAQLISNQQTNAQSRNIRLLQSSTDSTTFKYLDIFAEPTQQKEAISSQSDKSSAPSTTQSQPQLVPVIASGKLSIAFDPNTPSQTCNPAPKQMKIFTEKPGQFSTEKIVTQEFIAKFSKDLSGESSSQNMGRPHDMTLQLSAYSLIDPTNQPSVSPEMIDLRYSSSNSQEQRFTVNYNCGQNLRRLEQQGGKYYDTIRVSLNSNQAEIEFEYIVVCDAAKLRGFDINFLVLFAIAVLIIVAVIKSPPLQIMSELTAEEQEQTDLKLSSAVMFFFSASLMLFVLYYFLDSIKGIFTILIMISSIGCASIITEDLLLQVFKPQRDDFLRKEVKLPLFGECSSASIIGTIFGLVIALSWYFTHNWMLNNLLALVLAMTFLKTLRLTTMVPGLLLLGLLFFYDIFWVFLSPYFTKGGQSVMVVVATGLDIPIKMVMPHLTADYPTSACSLLGLGDILIPGIFICFMARFGFEVAQTNSYFYAAIISYSIALLCCGASLWVFKHAQPALLYIVPALYIAVFSVGLYRKEIVQLKIGLPKLAVSGSASSGVLSGPIIDNDDKKNGRYTGIADLEENPIRNGGAGLRSSSSSNSTRGGDYEMTSIRK